jgi:cysteine-rich repeat protein
MYKKIFLLFICLCSISAWSDPNSSGSESAVTIPPGCSILGEYYGQGVQKCVKDLQGASKCFIAKVSCCGNGRIDGPLTDSNTGDLISTQETCEMGTAGCRSDCTHCGDSVVNLEHGEVCDLGLRNGLPNSGCTTACTVPVCGNGIYEVSNSSPVEDCDGNDFPERFDNLPLEPTCDNQCKVHFCGDGVKNGSEACDGSDLGSVTDPDAVCNATCGFDPYCGDGVKNGSEACDGSDLGSVTNPDAVCNATCGFDPYCGDGVKNGSEACDGSDLGSVTDPDAVCNATCGFDPYCGDGVKNGSEACDGSDLGSVTDPDAVCNATCGFDPYCGDGVKNGSEACDGSDLGSVTNPDAVCNATCGFDPYCGDGVKNGSEACDGSDLGSVTDPDAVCNATCGFDPYCGDGVKNGSEACDGSDLGSVTDPDAVCNATCGFDPYCGDGVKNGSEACDGSDLGSVTDPDAVCNATCGFDPYCGDGVKNGSEACDGSDLGSVTDPDAVCNATCGFDPYCGDGVKNGSEACDGKDLGGITDKRVSCSVECAIDPYCGDGVKNGNEVCDGSDLGSVTDADAVCNATCGFYPYCGDGTVQASYRVGRATIKETCDDGNANDNDGCAANCHFECRWYRATASYLNYDGVARKAVVGSGFDLNELPCLVNFLGDNYQSILTRQGNATNNSRNATWTDDRLILKMLAYVYSQLPECSANYDACHGALDGFLEDTYELEQAIDPAEVERHRVARAYLDQVLGKIDCAVDGRCTDDKLRSLLSRRKLAFDGSCNLITLPDDFHAEQICGTVSIRAFISPISLIFDGEQADHGDRKLVQFALDPAQPDSWTLWRATPNNPLLVLLNSDGEVERLDGSSLFGNWTMGGKQSLLIPTGLNGDRSSSSRSAWLNGFEALGALDSNLDGEISKAELEQIGLWFDRNQNAKLDQGELESLKDNGVQRLFYKYDRVDTESQDTLASLGYEREIDGKLVRGAALDWFTQTYKTATEALAIGISNSVDQAPESDQQTKEVVEQKANTSNVAGTWVWGMRTQSEQVLPLGVLFLDVKGGVLSGESLSEQILNKDKSKQLSSIIAPIQLAGTVSLDDHLEFGLVAKDGSETRSSGKVVRPGVIEGVSKMLTAEANSSKEGQEVSYEWIAVKISQ